MFSVIIRLCCADLGAFTQATKHRRVFCATFIQTTPSGAFCAGVLSFETFLSNSGRKSLQFAPSV